MQHDFIGGTTAVDESLWQSPHVYRMEWYPSRASQGGGSYGYTRWEHEFVVQMMSFVFKMMNLAGGSSTGSCSLTLTRTYSVECIHAEVDEYMPRLINCSGEYVYTTSHNLQLILGLKYAFIFPGVVYQPWHVLQNDVFGLNYAPHIPRSRYALRGRIGEDGNGDKFVVLRIAIDIPTCLLAFSSENAETCGIAPEK